MDPRVLNCIWEESSPQDSFPCHVQHVTMSEVLNRERGWRFDPFHFKARLTRRPPFGNRLYYPNVESGRDKDRTLTLEIARNWHYMKGRIGYEAFAPWPIEVSWAMLQGQSHSTWLSRVQGFEQSWLYMGGAGVPLYRGQGQDDQWMVCEQVNYLEMLQTWIRWMRELVGDLPLYIVGSTHMKGADSNSPWQEPRDLAEQAGTVVEAGASFIVFDRLDSPQDYDRAIEMYERIRP